MTAVLQVEGLHKTFGGVQAVADVSFAIDAGELLALIGPNGAGKSTCFNMLNGQLAPDAGIVRLGGRDIVGLRPRAVWRLGVGRTWTPAGIVYPITITFTGAFDEFATPCLTPTGRYMKSFALMDALSSP